MPRRIQDNPRDRIESGSWRTVARPVDWDARREAVLARDRSCRWQEAGITCESTDRLEVHHKGDASDHSIEMLVLLCHRHHAKITGQQSAAARQAKRIPRQRPAERHPGLLP